MAAERRSRALPVALVVTFALVAAFAVSAIAGWGKSDPDAGDAPTGATFDPAALDFGGVRVEVLNGAGRAGLARDVTHRLREHGFDVVFFGNAGRFDHSRSVVIDRVGDPERARAVAASLGIDSVATRPDSTLLLDVTVVLGDDWPLTGGSPVAPGSDGGSNHAEPAGRPPAQPNP